MWAGKQKEALILQLIGVLPVVDGEEVDEAAGIQIGWEGNASVKGGESDRGVCKVDRLEAESQGTTTPTSGKVVVEILDNDDKPTPPNVAPKEETAQAHSKPGSSGKDETCVLKRKWSSDSGANYNTCSYEKKITRHQDSIGGGKTTSAQGKFGSAPLLSQARETTDAGQSSRSKLALDLACQLAVYSSLTLMLTWSLCLITNTGSGCGTADFWGGIPFVVLLSSSRTMNL